MIRFSGVVVDNIQDDLNSVGMQSRNQFFEFFNRRLAGLTSGMLLIPKKSYWIPTRKHFSSPLNSAASEQKSRVAT